MEASGRNISCLGLWMVVIYIVIGQSCARRLRVPEDNDHDCWYPLKAKNDTNQRRQGLMSQSAYFVYVSEDEKTCYYLSSNPAKLSYPEARAHCKTLYSDMDLIGIQSEQENKFILEEFLPSCEIITGDLNDCAVWLGLKFNRSCSWYDGSAFSWSNWNQYVLDQCTQAYADRYCVLLDASNNAEWNIRVCTIPTRILCEWQIDIPGASNQTASAGGGMVALYIIIAIILIIIILILLLCIIARCCLHKSVKETVLSLCGKDSDDDDDDDDDTPKGRKEIYKKSDDSVKLGMTPEKKSSGASGKEEKDKESMIEPAYQDPDETKPNHLKNKEKDPMLPKSPPTDSETAPGGPQDTYSVPMKKSKKKKPDESQEITVIENDMYA